MGKIAKKLVLILIITLIFNLFSEKQTNKLYPLSRTF